MKAEYEKSICFYQIYHSPNLLHPEEHSRQAIWRIFNDSFNEINNYEIDDASHSLIDIIEKTDSYIFGTLGRTYSPVLQRIRDMENKSTHPIGISSAEQLENYTYFLVSFAEEKIAYINSKIVSKLNETIMFHINRQNFIVPGEISILPITVKDPKKHIENLSKILSLDYTIIDDAENTYKSFYDVGDDLGLKSISYSLKFKETKKEAPVKKHASFILSNRKKYSNIKIIGQTKNGLEHIYSAIKNEIKLKKQLYLTNDIINNNQLIKQYLLDSFADIPELLME